MLPTVEPGEDVELVVGDARDLGPQTSERLLELGPQGLHIAEGDRGRHQGHQLLIDRAGVAVHHRDRIELEPRRNVAARPHPVERGANPVPPIAFAAPSTLA